ncbi:MAG: hypothetical protein HPY69_06255 [Armatimonadetes bacterium]|nr:hypothetical protein [Armatimonadota bacterium]
MKPVALTIILHLALVGAQTVVNAAPGPLAGAWKGNTLTALRSGNSDLLGVVARLQLLDPRTGQPTAPGRFTLTARLDPGRGALWLQGEVTASGTEDAIADLVLRVEGVSLPTGNGVDDLLLASSLVNKLPIAPLRTLANGHDQLALAMPADKPYCFVFRSLPAERAVEMRLPLGFSNDTRPELRMRAPFGIVLMPTDPQWHFRSALAQYYRLFPAMFARVEKRDGGWFFANEINQIPNPQHYAFFEGLGDVEETHAKGLGMYPYSETSSETIWLPGPGLPKDYEEAMRILDEMDRAIAPAVWSMKGGTLDDQVKHSGARSYKSHLPQAAGSGYAQQVIVPEEPIAEPVIVEAWSKAENVSGGSDKDYSIYVDCALEGGGYLFGQCALFSPGTHDWEKSSITITPDKPLADLRVYAMFRNHTGTAWFDDLRIYRQSHPEENLLANPGFEELGKRADIQYVRDNALTLADDRYLVFITDNLSADVPPDSPLSLLRFACNVDPDWRGLEGRPTPASRVTEMYDNLFRDHPGIDGAYIDSVAAWCCWSMNFRRDHLAAASHPLTYDPATFRVGQHGRFAMFKWLQFLQERYHPQGRTIFGNMGPSTEAWTNYTVLDIIGIESSQFRDRALMGYHRFGGYHKPVLPMNFINLHKLDDRATAEEFVLASAQWGEFPSTGRFVREGYESYGDVCHSYYPPLMEMARAGWEPEPLTTGVAAERFGTRPPLYFTVRAPATPRQARLTVLPEALAGLRNPLVMDAVQLTPVPSKLTAAGLEITWVDGAEVLTILRISSAEETRAWLLERAAHHCENAARVRGKSERTAPLEDLARQIRTMQPLGDARVGEVVTRLRQELARTQQGPGDLEQTSEERELLDAQRALAEWLLLLGGASLEVGGKAILPVSETAETQVRFTVGTSGARTLGTWVAPGRNILRLSDTSIIPGAVDNRPTEISAERPGAVQVRTAIRVPVPGAEPLTVIRASNVFFTPVVEAEVKRQTTPAGGAVIYRVETRRLAGPMALVVRAMGEGVSVEPASVTLGADDPAAEFRVSAAADDGTVRQVHFAVTTPEGKPLAEAMAEFRNLPVPPEGDLALASAGASVAADSSYPDYDPAVTIDGIWDPTGLHWTEAAWASADRAGEEGHWLEVRLPQAMPVSQAVIYWAIDNDQVMSSRSYEVQAWVNGAWQSVAEVRDASLSTVSRHQWPPVVTDRLRLHQPPGGGPASRPNIMWISEVCLY